MKYSGSTIALALSSTEGEAHTLQCTMRALGSSSRGICCHVVLQLRVLLVFPATLVKFISRASLLQGHTALYSLSHYATFFVSFCHIKQTNKLSFVMPHRHVKHSLRYGHVGLPTPRGPYYNPTLEGKTRVFV
jgi:hypothetical protein